MSAGYSAPEFTEPDAPSEPGKDRARHTLEIMYSIRRRFPFNLLRAHWMMWPEVLEDIKAYHNPAVIDLITDDQGQTFAWGTLIRTDETYTSREQVALVVTGRL